MPARSSGSGSSRSPGKGSAEGATGGHPPSASATPPRSLVKPEYVEPLRPAWASWIPAVAPWRWTNSTMRAQAACCSAFQSPVSSGEIRPSGVTTVASVKTRPAPPRAKEPRCTRCQSFGTPSTAEYWHIGATHTRLRTVTSRRVIGVNIWVTGAASWVCGTNGHLRQPGPGVGDSVVRHRPGVPGVTPGERSELEEGRSDQVRRGRRLRVVQVSGLVQRRLRPCAHRRTWVRGDQVHAQTGDHRARVVLVETVEREAVVEQRRRLEEHLASHLEVHLRPCLGHRLGGGQELVEGWIHAAGGHATTLAARPSPGQSVIERGPDVRTAPLGRRAA